MRRYYRDKNGREFIKETYFVGGKMKFHRIYVIDGIPAVEFYEKNATDLEFYLNQHEFSSKVNEPRLDSALEKLKISQSFEEKLIEE